MSELKCTHSCSDCSRLGCRSASEEQSAAGTRHAGQVFDRTVPAEQQRRGVCQRTQYQQHEQAVQTAPKALRHQPL